MIGEAIVQGYLKHPQTEEELVWAHDSAMAMIEEEPWGHHRDMEPGARPWIGRASITDRAERVPVDEIGLHRAGGENVWMETVGCQTRDGQGDGGGLLPVGCHRDWVGIISIL